MHFYFDMDGVLVRFDEGFHVSQEWRKPGYFKNCEPDRIAVMLAHCLHAMPNHSVRILTRVLDEPENIRRWTRDKKAWMKENMPFISLSREFTCTAAPVKSEILRDVPEHARLLHVLVDDDPKMLEEWRRAGGTSVQYIQAHRKCQAPFRGRRLFAANGLRQNLVSLINITKTL